MGSDEAGRAGDECEHPSTIRRSGGLGLLGSSGRPYLAADLLDAPEHLLAQVAGRLLAAAGLVHQLLDGLFEPVLAHARSALVQVLAHLSSSAPGHPVGLLVG